MYMGIASDGRQTGQLAAPGRLADGHTAVKLYRKTQPCGGGAGGGGVGGGERRRRLGGKIRSVPAWNLK